jgi:hypothetical protein
MNSMKLILVKHIQNIATRERPKGRSESLPGRQLEGRSSSSKWLLGKPERRIIFGDGMDSAASGFVQVKGREKRKQAEIDTGTVTSNAVHNKVNP